MGLNKWDNQILAPFSKGKNSSKKYQIRFVQRSRHKAKLKEGKKDHKLDLLPT